MHWRLYCARSMRRLPKPRSPAMLLQAGNSLSDRFLFVTGDVVSINTHEFLTRYRLPHVAKPFRMEELKDCVRGLLDHCSRHRPRVTQKKKNDEVRLK